jgi:hypothetical protein
MDLPKGPAKCDELGCIVARILDENGCPDLLFIPAWKHLPNGPKPCDNDTVCKPHPT